MAVQQLSSLLQSSLQTGRPAWSTAAEKLAIVEPCNPLITAKSMWQFRQYCWSATQCSAFCHKVYCCFLTATCSQNIVVFAVQNPSAHSVCSKQSVLSMLCFDLLIWVNEFDGRRLWCWLRKPNDFSYTLQIIKMSFWGVAIEVAQL